MPSSAPKQKPPKQRARALERLLRKADLPEAVRAAKQAELDGLRGDVQRAGRVARERKFSKRYHGVKFVERRKVERRIGQLERRLAAAGGGG